MMNEYKDIYNILFFRMYLSLKHFPELNLLPLLLAYHIMWKMKISEGEKYK